MKDEKTIFYAKNSSPYKDNTNSELLLLLFSTRSAGALPLPPEVGGIG